MAFAGVCNKLSEDIARVYLTVVVLVLRMFKMLSNLKLSIFCVHQILALLNTLVKEVIFPEGEGGIFSEPNILLQLD